jgi:2-amino-4-hydroxy-6-hydroxymethyldihydropteridine diphosphokinase
MSPTLSQGPPLILGLGANLGDTLGTLRRAARRLISELGPGWHGVSGLYVSAPIGPEQPDFLNSALLTHPTLGPLEVLQLVQAIEREFGRVREERWGPRTLDVDILWAGWRSDTPELTVPHPELPKRAFAFSPFMELWARLPEAARGTLPLEWTSAHAEEARRQQRIHRTRGPEWISDVEKRTGVQSQ